MRFALVRTDKILFFFRAAIVPVRPPARRPTM